MNIINGWLNIDKQIGISSMKAVSIIKKILKPGKIGHAGTLDPLANGVLPMAIGAATKLIEFCMDSTKRYKFTVKMGAITDTLDSEGQILDTTLCIPTKDELENACSKFIGTISQVPPKFSALKVSGVRAYKLARETDVDFTLEARNIQIHTLSLIDYDDKAQTAEFITTCSKGTYIRSIARDIMEYCGSLGYVIKLTRESVGNFELSAAINLKKLQELDLMVARNLLLTRIVRIEQILFDNNIKQIEISELEASKIRYGQSVELNSNDEQLVWLSSANNLVAVGSIKNSLFVINKTFNL